MASKAKKASIALTGAIPKLKIDMPLNAAKIKAIQRCIAKGKLTITVSKVDLANGRIGEAWLYDERGTAKARPAHMKILEAGAGTAHVGLAYGPSAIAFNERHPGAVDYIEIPFEQLRHSPDLASIGESIPMVLHCASLSVAGFVAPTEATIAAIDRAAQFTRSPWIGEHLAFVSADGLAEDSDVGASPTTLTYTLCPQLSEETVERVTQNLAALAPQFSVPLILENSPQYFFVPGSTMGMVDFVREVAARSNVGLLLDLTHFLITALNTGIDAAAEVERLPLERVVEIHVSGLSKQSNVAWDDHAAPAPPLVFDLLAQVLKRAKPRAVTLEYNWAPSFPQSLLAAHIDQIRGHLARA